MKSLTIVGCTGALALFLGGQAAAQELVLDLSVAVGEGEPQVSQVAALMGEETEIEAKEGYRLLVVPTSGANSRVRLSFRLYETASESDEPIAAPIIETMIGRKAGTSMGSEPPGANNLSIQVTPTSP